MNCKRIKELITTGYIDKELDEKLMKDIEAHLKVCHGCGAFEELLRKAAVEPFKNAQEIKPPAYLWKRIRENIEKEGGIREQWVFSIPRPVFAATAAIAVCVILMIVLSATLNSHKQLDNYIQDQGEFLSNLDPSSRNSLTNNHSGFGTTIEEFFS